MDQLKCEEEGSVNSDSHKESLGKEGVANCLLASE